MEKICKYNINDAPWDKVVDEFVSGKLSKDQVKGLMQEKLWVRTNIIENDLLEELDSRIEYAPTGTTLIYHFDGKESLYISDANSRDEDCGGFSILLSELEEIAMQKNIPSLTLNVYEKNTRAIEIYSKKGFREINRMYETIEKDFLIRMQKDLA